MEARADALRTERDLDTPEKSWLGETVLHIQRETHPEVSRAFTPERRREPNPDVEIEPPLPIGVAMMRKIVREELREALGVPKIAYTIDEAAAACGVGRSSLYRAINTHQLGPRYFGSKPLFQEEELRRWIASLPDEAH
ncbi:helix-turn-helix domain-containing protein [Labedella endophytica]|jgi:excisionase family DNA binding protein|nr:helix-turn-helix domain-containing protein [Labedella endophytica]